jgi:hypothetical protein
MPVSVAVLPVFFALLGSGLVVPVPASLLARTPSSQQILSR